MSQETRIRTIIKEMHAGDKEVHDISDRISNLGRYQKYAVEQTFGKEAAPKKTFEDLIAFYKTLNRSFNLGLSDEISELECECGNFEKELQDILGNVDDRYLIRPRIEDFLAKDKERKNRFAEADIKPVIFDAKYIDGDTSVAIDTIVVTSGGIVLLEMMSPTRNIGIDEKGNYMAFNYREARMDSFSLLERIRIKQKMIFQILRNHEIQDIPIYSAVVFSGNLAYSNHCEEIKIIRDSQIPRYFETFCKDNVLDLQKQCQITELLDENRQEEPEPNYSEEKGLVEAYADLRSKVEARILEETVDVEAEERG